MASIFRQRYTVKDADGKTIRKQSKFWYIDYKAGRDGQRRRVKGFKDKTATAQLAAKLEREAELGRAGIVDRFKEHRLRPLSEHLEDFRKALGDTTKHARHTYNAVKSVFEACRFYRWGDISASKFLNHLSTVCEIIFWRSISFFLTKHYVLSHCERSEAISFVRKREIATARLRRTSQ